jgi:DNA-binding MarR family transcriptional regulator
MNAHVNGTPMGLGKHWPVEEAAGRLGMTRDRLSRLIGTGAVKTINRGPLGIRIDESEIIRVRNQLAQPSQPPAGPRVPGLSETESAVLLALWTAGTPLTIAELAKYGVPGGSAVRVLDKLLAAGLIRRTRRAQHRPAWCYRAAQSPSSYAESLVRHVHDAIGQADATPAAAAGDHESR